MLAIVAFKPATRASSGADAVCIDRRLGSYPVKTLTVEVGTKRPLGIGAGSLAILRGAKVDTLAGEPTYYVSDLDWFSRARMSLSSNMGQLLLVTGLGTALLAGLVLRLLQAQFRKRTAR